MDQEHKNIPPQQEGFPLEAKASITLASEAEASQVFEAAKKRLMDVNNWQNYAGTLGGAFQLTDSRGKEVQDRKPQEGDHFRVDIPGPGTKAGGGYDWVLVEKIEENKEGQQELCSIRVRPSENPLAADAGIAHFFDPKATSTFIVKREGLLVTAAIFDRNAQPNDEVKNLADKVRNAAVATGAISGMAKLQWKSLAEGVLGKK